MIKLLNWKYRYFRKKIKAVQATILDLEFKRFKTLEIREEVRQTYDQAKSKLAVLNEEIKKQAEKPTMEKGEIARLDDQRVLLERDVKRYEDQILALDVEVYGSNKTNEYPDGHQGINQQLDAFHELLGMIKSYMNNL